MSHRTILEPHIAEGVSAWYQAKLVDRNGTGVDADALTTLTLTFFAMDDPAETIINSRTQQNVLNENEVTLDSAGNLQWAMQPEDTVILDQRRRLERRIALFEWVGPVVGSGKHEVVMTIVNVPKV